MLTSYITVIYNTKVCCMSAFAQITATNCNYNIPFRTVVHHKVSVLFVVYYISMQLQSSGETYALPSITAEAYHQNCTNCDTNMKIYSSSPFIQYSMMPKFAVSGNSKVRTYLYIYHHCSLSTSQDQQPYQGHIACAVDQIHSTPSSQCAMMGLLAYTYYGRGLHGTHCLRMSVISPVFRGFVKQRILTVH